MKKIFAISVLSIMTVLSSNAWATDTGVGEAYGLGSAADYNIATVQFVDENYIQSKYNPSNSILTTSNNGSVSFSSTIEQGQVSGLAYDLAAKVDDTQIANADATLASGDMDTMVPTVQRMANAISEAVSAGVGAVDLSSRVAVDQGTDNANKVLVTGADGIVTTATTITQAQVDGLAAALDAKVGTDDVIVDTMAGTQYLLQKGIAMEEGDDAAKTELQSKVLGGDMAYGIVKGLNIIQTTADNAIPKADIVTLAEDSAADAEMEAGTNVDTYDTVVPSYRLVHNALNMLESEVEAGLGSKVDKAQGEANKNAIMITNASGTVVPALVGECTNTTNKCALVTGVDESGNLVLEWEVIARNVATSAEE